ncbi:MAG: hypothetical protein K2W81_10510 [Sphingomonas sp.]|uniref:hypothetical protein n=1 Tax=Sphingomonas sp. TaxID=28214 RepID=UPI0025CCBC26|nr:hypothetical protein [Sphingomonas sp.]MBY0284381.1 hypothetical protein [Sphingomonas sp.]
MAVIQLLVMPEERRPDFADVFSAASASDIPFKPEEVDLVTHTGFLPVEVEGLATGFEYYFDEIESGALPDEAMRFGSHQMISRTGGDMAEMLASLLFFRASAKLSGAAYVYPDDAIIIPPNEVDRYLTDQITMLRKYLK